MLLHMNIGMSLGCLHINVGLVGVLLGLVGLLLGLVGGLSGLGLTSGGRGDLGVRSPEDRLTLT